MKKNSTVIVLCVLLICADAVAVAQTVTDQPEFMLQTLAAGIVMAAALAWVAFQLIRKSILGKNGPLPDGGSQLFSRYAVYSYLFGLRGLAGNDLDIAFRNAKPFGKKLDQLRISSSINRR